MTMDLSAIGIATTSQTYALRMEGDAMAAAGICDGDIVILEPGTPKRGDIVAVYRGPGAELTHYSSVGGETAVPEEANVRGVAVGLIRRL